MGAVTPGETLGTYTTFASVLIKQRNTWTRTLAAAKCNGCYKVACATCQLCNLPVTRNLPLAVVDSLRVGTVNTGGGTPSSRRPFSFTLCHRGSEPGSENSLMTDWERSWSSDQALGATARAPTTPSTSALLPPLPAHVSPPPHPTHTPHLLSLSNSIRLHRQQGKACCTRSAPPACFVWSHAPRKFVAAPPASSLTLLASHGPSEPPSVLSSSRYTTPTPTPYAHSHAMRHPNSSPRLRLTPSPPTPLASHITYDQICEGHLPRFDHR